MGDIILSVTDHVFNGLSKVTSHLMQRDVWFITGASSGFGLSTVKELLKQGYKVAATSRSKSRLLEGVGAHDESRLLALELDLTSDAEIQAAVDAAIAKFGQIDVCVNNAAYGQRGTVEELTRAQVSAQFELNVLAVHAVYRAILPHFRSRRNGYLLTISSTIAFLPPGGLGIYGASKAALTAMTEALAQEVAAFGIKVTSCDPGPFDTNFNAQAHWCDKLIPDYAAMHERMDGWKNSTARRPGDPDRAAKLFIELAKSPSPPGRIFLGKWSVDAVLARCDGMKKEIEQWKAQSYATDYE
jgi:NAD(P)-dependent dehydrogenase (short-subunit alcohol dehydrogenase family)